MIPSDDYNEPDSYDYQSERETDLHYLIARLSLRDLVEFPWTYRSKKLQWEVVRGIILKGTIYKRDFLEFLEHPVARIAKVRYYDSDSAGWYYGYGGVDENLTGLEIDWQHKTIHFPDRVSAEPAPGHPKRIVSDATARRRPRDRLSALLVWPDHRLLSRDGNQAHLYARAARAHLSARRSAQTE